MCVVMGDKWAINGKNARRELQRHSNRSITAARNKSGSSWHRRHEDSRTAPCHRCADKNNDGWRHVVPMTFRVISVRHLRIHMHAKTLQAYKHAHFCTRKLTAKMNGKASAITGRGSKAAGEQEKHHGWRTHRTLEMPFVDVASVDVRLYVRNMQRRNRALHTTS